MNKLTEHAKRIQLVGYRERERLPETCPVCDSPPRTYQGGKNDLNRWKHKICYECDCYLYITEENASGPIVDIPCPKAHGLAVDLRALLEVAKQKVEWRCPECAMPVEWDDDRWSCNSEHCGTSGSLPKDDEPIDGPRAEGGAMNDES